MAIKARPKRMYVKSMSPSSLVQKPDCQFKFTTYVSYTTIGTPSYPDSRVICASELDSYVEEYRVRRGSRIIV